jgi:hypothetical protein
MVSHQPLGGVGGHSIINRLAANVAVEKVT